MTNLEKVIWEFRLRFPFPLTVENQSTNETLKIEGIQKDLFNLNPDGEVFVKNKNGVISAGRFYNSDLTPSGYYINWFIAYEFDDYIEYMDSNSPSKTPLGTSDIEVLKRHQMVGLNDVSIASKCLQVIEKLPLWKQSLNIDSIYRGLIQKVHPKLTNVNKKI